MSTTARTSQEVGKIYDTVSAVVDAFCGGQFHLGYWYDDADDASVVEAAERITRRVALALGLAPGERLLDLGCGPGATALFLAQQSGAAVTGISVSAFDVDQARQRASDQGLAGRAHFEVGDYSSLSFPDASFDAVTAVESLLSAPDLDHVLRQAFRVLRPGGRVVLCHCTLEAELSPVEAEQFARSISAKRLPTLAQWGRALTDAGFTVDEHLQMGPRVYGMGHKYVEAVEQRSADLVERFGAETISAFQQGLRDFFAAPASDVGYAIVVGRKPR